MAEEIDDEYYIDILLTTEDIETLLRKEFVKGNGHLNREQVNVLVVLKEEKEDAPEKRKK
jgi:hypothetical protein